MYLQGASPDMDVLLDWLERELTDPLSRLDWNLLSRHNRAYLHYRDAPFARFVRNEWPYYRRVLGWYSKNLPVGCKVVDLGMFVPVIPLALAHMGYRVETVERMSLYGGALDPICHLARSHGIVVHDRDIAEDQSVCSNADAVNFLAVAEHLLGSPRSVLNGLSRCMPPSAYFLFVVPNQARLSRRLSLLIAGKSVQPDFEDYFYSEYPFEGHHREYTREEVRFALTRGGFKISSLTSIKYPARGSLLEKAVTLLGNLLPPTFHQVHFAVATPAPNSIQQMDPREQNALIP